MKTAQVILKTEDNTFVLCPYCVKPHTHGISVKGDVRVSHCMSGEYTIGDPFDFNNVTNAVTRREKDIERKRALREAARREKEEKKKATA